MTLPKGLLGNTWVAADQPRPFHPHTEHQVSPRGLELSLSASTAPSLPAILSPPFPGGGGVAVSPHSLRE